MNKEVIRTYINVIERALVLIKEQLGDIPISKSKEVEKPEPVVDLVPPQKKFERSRLIESILQNSSWPVAVPNYAQGQVTNEDQINRANAVLDTILIKSLENERFLDYGCGEGWIASEAAGRGASEIVGYDPKFHDNWNNIKNVKFTSDYSALTGKFKTIFLYDVLDHCSSPQNVMEHIKSLLAPSGVVYVRCHPWTSKHASHVYKNGLNLSYIHLFLTNQELEDLGYNPLYTRMEKNPLESYRWWFNQFRIDKERIIKEPVPEFFNQLDIKDLLIKSQDLDEETKEQFFNDMQFLFIDYILR